MGGSAAALEIPVDSAIGLMSVENRSLRESQAVGCGSELNGLSSLPDSRP